MLLMSSLALLCSKDASRLPCLHLCPAQNSRHNFLLPAQVEDISAELVSHGFSYSGKDYLTSGITGRETALTLPELT